MRKTSFPSDDPVLQPSDKLWRHIWKGPICHNVKLVSIHIWWCTGTVLSGFLSSWETDGFDSHETRRSTAVGFRNFHATAAPHPRPTTTAPWIIRPLLRLGNALNVLMCRLETSERRHSHWKLPRRRQQTAILERGQEARSLRRAELWPRSSADCRPNFTADARRRSRITLSLLSSKSAFSQHFIEKCISDAVRIW